MSLPHALRSSPLYLLLVLFVVAAACRLPEATEGEGFELTRTDRRATDPLAFLAPFTGGRFDRTIGSGENALAAHVTTEVLLPGVLVRQRTEALVDGTWTTVVESFFGHDPRRGVVTFRAWTIDGAFMEGTANGGNGVVVVDFELFDERGVVPLRQRYEFDGPSRCAWATVTRDEENERLFDAGEMRRAAAQPLGQPLAPATTAPANTP
jgi:hypothetical protein